MAVDLISVMSNEITILGSMGYPDEIFEVTKDIVANWEKYAQIVSHTIPFDDVADALRPRPLRAPRTRSSSFSTEEQPPGLPTWSIRVCRPRTATSP